MIVTFVKIYLDVIQYQILITISMTAKILIFSKKKKNQKELGKNI